MSQKGQSHFKSTKLDSHYLLSTVTMKLHASRRCVQVTGYLQVNRTEYGVWKRPRHTAS